MSGVAPKTWSSPCLDCDGVCANCTDVSAPDIILYCRGRRHPRRVRNRSNLYFLNHMINRESLKKSTHKLNKWGRSLSKVINLARHASTAPSSLQREDLKQPCNQPTIASQAHPTNVHKQPNNKRIQCASTRKKDTPNQ